VRYGTEYIFLWRCTDLSECSVCFVLCVFEHRAGWLSSIIVPSFLLNSLAFVDEGCGFRTAYLNSSRSSLV